LTVIKDFLFFQISFSLVGQTVPDYRSLMSSNAVVEVDVPEQRQFDWLVLFVLCVVEPVL
jgi:hypothetical protein